MKIYKTAALLIIVLLWLFDSYAQPCFPDGVTFENQTDIDNFQIDYPNCSNIGGNVIIGNNYGDITNLVGLSIIDTIQGDLVIIYNPDLYSLNGLQNLKYVGGSLTVKNNYILQSISSLGNLNHIGANLFIDGNYKLVDLTGLDSIASIPQGLRIENNGDLLQLTGLQNLSSVGSYFVISHNFKLISASQLENLDSVGTGFLIFHNYDLIDLEGLENLSFVGGPLTISSNYSLTSLTGLDNINYETLENLYIDRNSELSFCEIQSVCDFLENNSYHYSIHSNAEGCNSDEEILSACETVNTTSKLEAQIYIYPNPTNGKVFIAGINANDNIEIELFNNLGIKVLQDYGLSDFIDISTLAKGFYTIQIEINESILIRKLIIQ